jgi:hypothetical protein
MTGMHHAADDGMIPEPQMTEMHDAADGGMISSRR